MILLKQMLIFFFLMLLGYYSARKGVMDQKVSKSVSWIVVNGTYALMYASVFLIPFNLLIYTYGVLCMGGKGGKKRLAEIFNAGVAACVLSFFISLLKINVSDMAVNAIQMLSNLTAPLSMMVIGASFADIRPKELVEDRKMVLFCGIRLLVIPVLGMMV